MFVGFEMIEPFLLLGLFGHIDLLGGRIIFLADFI